MASKQLNVNLDEVVEAMEISDELMLGGTFCLDTDTGAVKMIGGDVSFDVDDLGNEFPEDASGDERDQWEECREVANDTLGRFQEIPSRESHGFVG